MNRHPHLRRLGALGVVGAVAGLNLLLGAAPAFASGSITDPVDGTVFDRSTSFTIKASINTTTSTDLVLQGPTGGSQVVDNGRGTVTDGSAALSYFFDTSCSTYPSRSCNGSAPAANGTWSITLRGGASDSRSFVLRIPPATPANISASGQGYRAATVTWRRGAEPDLTGYVLYDNGAAAQDVALSACNGSSCSTTVTYDRDGTGAHAYSLVAKRLAAAGSSATLSSARSGEVSITLGSPPPPPPPSPTSNPTPTAGSGGSSGSGGGTPSPGASSGSGSGTTSGGTASGSGAGSGSGGKPSAGTSSGSGSSSGSASSGSKGIDTSSSPATAIAQRRAFGLSFSAFGPKLGIPKLPPLPATQPAVAAPLPDGSYETTLGYKDVTTREKVSAPEAAVRRVGDAVGLAVDSERLVTSLAGALILLALAGHLRVWLGKPTEH